MTVLLLGLAVVLFDQLTKLWVRSVLIYGGEAVPVIPGLLNLVYVRNDGAAWGMLGGQQPLLILFSLVVLTLLAVMHHRVLNPTWDHRLALGLMTGGICGNLIDRIRLGWVMDFVDVYVGSAHWPAFNVADASICTAVGIYLLSSLWHSRHPLKGDPHVSP